MKILHVPTEIAGQMQTLVSGLRESGHTVNGYNWFHTYLKYGGGIINTDAYELKNVMEALIRYADLIHFHNGNSFLIHNTDLPILHQIGKKMVMHHWGNDVRSRSGALLRNPYPIPPSYLTDESIHKRLLHLSCYIQHSIVQDYELYPYVSDYYRHVHVLPLACRVTDIPCSYPSPANRNPVIIHAPTNRLFKGSEYIEKAIKDLIGVHPFHYKAIEKMNHQEAMRMYAASDIIVDQILCGTYGMLSVEAMAMGKVVVAFIRDDVKVKFPKELPIVIANPDTIRDVLGRLIKDPELRHRIGIESRKYAESLHDVKVVIPKLLNIYKQIERTEV